MNLKSLFKKYNPFKSTPYMKPNKFRKHVLKNSMHISTLEVKTDSISEVQTFIKNIREINKKDPRFKYTCECDLFYTTWHFAYSDEQFQDEVREICRQLLPDALEGIRLPYSIGSGNACVCPFNVR